MVEDGDDARAVTPVIGNILLVAVVVVLAIVLVLLSLTFLEETGAPTAEASFDYEQTPAGLRMTPEALGTDVAVKLNGKRVTTFSADSAGESVLLPTAPGDSITVVSQDGDRSVLVNKQVDDRSEVGNFISYYTFNSEAGTTLEDRSNNDNDAVLKNDKSGDGWTNNGYDFTGNEYFEVNDFNTPVNEVSEFTIAVAYETDTGDQKQELVEHIANSKNDNWGVEIKQCENWPNCNGSPNDTYNPTFFVDEKGGAQTGQIFGGTQDTGQRRVIVGTYDGSTQNMYVDGERKGKKSFGSDVNMGDFYIGTDAEDAGNRDNLDGEIYEIRLYYEAFDQQEVEVVTNAMS